MRGETSSVGNRIRKNGHVKKKKREKKEEEVRTRVTREGETTGTNEGNTMILTAMLLSGR